MNTVKLLEQMPAGSFRNTNPVIPDDESDSPVLAVAGHLDLGRPTAELDGVLEQVIQRGAQPLGVAEHWQGSVSQIEVEPTLFELYLRLHPIDRLRNHRAQIEGGHLWRRSPVLQAGEQQHPLDLRPHLARFVHQRSQGLLRRRRHLAERSLFEQRGIAADDGERRAQLMGGDLHELTARPLQLGERFCPAALAFERVPGVERNCGLGGEQLQPPQLLRAKPSGPPPLQADEPHEVLAGAHREVDGRLDASELGTPPGPIGELLVGRRIRHIDRDLRIR